MSQSLEEIRSLVEKEVQAIHNIPVDESILNAIDALYDQIHINKGKIVISGIGKAGQIGQNIATTFCSTGSPAVFLHPSEAQHGDLGVLQPNDILLVISNSGKTEEILKLLELADNLYPKIKTICITGHPENELGRTANICLSTGQPKEICPLDLTPTTSTTVMSVLGDLLVVMLMKKINFDKAGYAKRHHSGYLGQKSRMQ
ncbi:MAG: SIS domain-containing protein [Imperialibacter sp.]|jgi:arabinose-5-phosphate isomerase|uniref:KpsF/GutQ family sugar-phosphate isomerase n=1 Tax=Imperialibacter sp. TaxID=2038411 RepID=UPI0032EEFA7B